MLKITPTDDERASNALTSDRLAQVVTAIRTDGYAVLEQVVSHDHLDPLHERMDRDAQKLIAAERWSGAGAIPGHLQLSPPPFAPFVFADVVANPFAVQVTHAMLGDGLFNGFYSGNTNCPGSGAQPLHRDVDHLWPATESAHPPASLVVNIAPHDVDETNGGIELWPGTHLDTEIGSVIDAEAEEARRAVTPPIRACTSKGDVLIRDMRLWHRGVPNISDSPRHMIAMIHNIGWLARGRQVRFASGCESVFPNCALDHHTTFTDERIDYLGLG